MKVCRECNKEKPLSDFYKHPKMADGHLNKCSECVKARVAKHREVNLEKVREYDKKRSVLPHRVQARKDYLQTEQGKATRKRAIESYRERYPLKRAAHIITRNAVRDGKLKPAKSCSVCGSKKLIEGHHDDYTKPLEVRWLCNKCHRAWHRENTPIYE
jgi:ribosomal protein S27AE